MRTLARSDAPQFVRRILTHLGIWATRPPVQSERAPPAGTEAGDREEESFGL